MIIFCRVRIAYFFSRPFSLLSILLLSNQRELHTFRYSIQTAPRTAKLCAHSTRGRSDKLLTSAGEAILVCSQSTIAPSPKHYCFTLRPIVVRRRSTSGSPTLHPWSVMGRYETSRRPDADTSPPKRKESQLPHKYLVPLPINTK